MRAQFFDAWEKIANIFCISNISSDPPTHWMDISKEAIMLCIKMSSTKPYNFNRDDKIHQFVAVAWVFYVVRVIQNRRTNGAKQNGAGFENLWNDTCAQVRKAFQLKHSRNANQGTRSSSRSTHPPLHHSIASSSTTNCVPRQGSASSIGVSFPIASLPPTPPVTAAPALLVAPATASSVLPLRLPPSDHNNLGVLSVCLPRSPAHHQRRP